MDFRIISIGTLAAHPLWDEQGEVRTGHPTTTLVSTGEAHIIVDPGLPDSILAARMAERTNVQPNEVTHVFLTSLTMEHYRGISIFDRAEWYAFEAEGVAAMAALRDQLERTQEADEDELTSAVNRNLDIVRRCRAAGDSLAPGVDLFPLPGVTPGCCGLLLPLPRATVLMTGDAVATFEHLAQGKVLPHCANLEQAQESFREAIEIADILILGRDNMTFNPMRQMQM